MQKLFQDTLIFISLVLQVQGVLSGYNALLPREPVDSIYGNISLPLGLLAQAHGANGLGGNLVERQETCEIPGWLPCPDELYCCPAGQTCQSSSSCCVDPGDTRQWEPCQNLPLYCCLAGYNCCTNQCCPSYGYCGSDGDCHSCPVPETITTTITQSVQVTVTEFEEPDEATDFSCFPLTVTNSEGATLELDTDCALSYSPPGATSSASASASASAFLGPSLTSLTPRKALLARQTSPCLDTGPVTTTESSTLTDTITTTITQSESEFTCPTMAVTNPAGAVLSLDESCSLEYSPPPATSTAPSTASSTAPSTAFTTSTPNSAGISIPSNRVFTWQMPFIISFALLTFIIMVF